MTSLAVLGAFIRRDWRINISYRAGTALEFATMLFSLALFFYLGHLIDNPAFEEQQGLEGGYFAYAVVGLALVRMVQASLSSFSRKLREEQTTGTFEVLMATPNRPAIIVLSSAAYDLLRATLSALVLLLAAVVIFGVNLDTSPDALAVTALALVGCIGLFASLGVCVAAFTVVFKRSTAFLALIVAFVSLLGGAYFPLSVLPEPLESIARALPFTWALDVLRDALLGGDVDYLQLAGLFAATAVVLPLMLGLFAVALRRARQTGSMAQY
jgi:ABC-type polysaccharide/polyol phosphate export permease